MNDLHRDYSAEEADKLAEALGIKPPARAAPRRAFVLTLNVGADARDDLIGVLRQLEFEIGADRLTEGVSGGYSSGYTYKLEVDESMTHDRYFEELNRHLAEKEDKE